ncbi:hypothetical protein R6242_18885 [Iodobacter sp. CM08]|uniref:hypothetical protein n=1 Tax=Iodobacter sp. CM08 TaxID=3085902 RepID=UPI0029812CBD|nr:hypothetical protein [Iodobacter sp. CM08]MDW5418635.1 hypothetical protein [Iodobacter sp. CM08]
MSQNHPLKNLRIDAVLKSAYGLQLSNILPFHSFDGDNNDVSAESIKRAVEEYADNACVSKLDGKRLTIDDVNKAISIIEPTKITIMNGYAAINQYDPVKGNWSSISGNAISNLSSQTIHLTGEKSTASRGFEGDKGIALAKVGDRLYYLSDAPRCSPEDCGVRYTKSQTLGKDIKIGQRLSVDHAGAMLQQDNTPKPALKSPSVGLEYN